MTISVSDSLTLRRALRRLGWAQTGSFRGALEYWAPKNPDGAAPPSIGLDRLIVPIVDTAADAQDLLDDASNALLQRYGREYAQTLEMIKLMVARHLDEVEVRRETPNNAGLIRWQLGDEAIESTRGILSASARAAISKKKRFASAENVVSEEFLSQCYMGQTKVGSYVITALTPAEASIVTSRAKPDPKRPSPRVAGRLITDTLVGSLEAVKDAIAEAHRSREDQVNDAFELAVMSGVSYELLAALEPLTRETESSIQVAYFRTGRDDLDEEPVQQPTHEITFTPEDSKIIAQARAYFAKTPDPRPMRLTGEVTDLKNSSAAAEHRIKLATRVNGRPRTVTVNLTADQYAHAVDAHGQERMFTVFGELETRQRGAYVETPETVRVENTLVSDEVRSSGSPRSDVPPPPLFE
ncbi:hypothetical protein [Agromyces sp. LHK192]|uniref:hypothetical protein n=1 Tax=Agromyces sp. LHK192 TaxID=2498704 RepID=UPI000FDBE424|nr:hypothetical protein [Agromyces sp. LHK192]